MEHDDFTSIFIVCLKQLMQSDFNQFSNLGLKFMAGFVTSFQAEDMHPLFDSLFLWILKVSQGSVQRITYWVVEIQFLTFRLSVLTRAFVCDSVNLWMKCWIRSRMMETLRNFTAMRFCLTWWIDWRSVIEVEIEISSTCGVQLVY